jgi:hypothetical protein
VPGPIGAVVSRRFATLHELDSVYGTEDLFDMLEIISVDGFNQRAMSKQKE